MIRRGCDVFVWRGVVGVLVLGVVVAGVGVGPVHAGFVASGEGGDVLVVDDDGEGAFSSIQSAVDAAEAGDRVEVRPGTYREQVVVGKNVTVVAPAGATLAGGEFEGLSSGFEIEAGVAPVVAGFTVRGYAFGVNADRPPRQGLSEYYGREGWVVRNVTFVDCEEEAVRAGNSMTDWTVEDVRIEGEGAYVGIATFGSHGDWTIRNVEIRNVSFDAIGASTGGGEWTIRNVSIVDAGTGVDAGFSNGEGRVVDVTIRDVETGVSLHEANATVTMTGVVVEDVAGSRGDSSSSGVAVYASKASRDWRIRDSVLRNVSGVAVDATGASPPGVATGNWWGDDGRHDGACVGNVDCADALSEQPTAGASLVDPGAPDAPAKTTTRTTASTNEGTTDRKQSDATSSTGTTPTGTTTGATTPSGETTVESTTVDDETADSSDVPGFGVIVAGLGVLLTVALGGRVARGHR